MKRAMILAAMAAVVAMVSGCDFTDIWGKEDRPNVSVNGDDNMVNIGPTDGTDQGKTEPVESKE